MDSDESKDNANTETTTTENPPASATTTAAYNAVYNSDGTITYYYSGGNGSIGSHSHNYNNRSINVITGSSGYVHNYGSIGSTTNSTSQFSYSTPTYQAHIDYAGGKITAKSFELDGTDVSGLLDKICDRLAIIESADPEQLEKYNALNEAYKRYKFLENLLVDKGKADGNK